MSPNIIAIIFLVIFAMGVIAFRRYATNYGGPVVKTYMNFYDIYVWIRFIGVILLLGLFLIIYIFAKK